VHPGAAKCAPIASGAAQRNSPGASGGGAGIWTSELNAASGMVAHGLPGGSAHTAAEIRPPGRSTRGNSVMAPAMSEKNRKPNLSQSHKRM
jgi:hypothetical protein